MKWTHSILQEPTFCTEWQAQTIALRLSFECGTIGDNTSCSEHRQLRLNRLVPQHVSFAEDVTVMCSDVSRFACAMTHCQHGAVQTSICLLQDKLHTNMVLEAAPLSSFHIGTAVSSSQTDETSYMQSFSYPTPRCHNEMDAPPWYPFDIGPARQHDPSDDEINEDSSEDSSDEIPRDNEPPDGSDPHPPADAHDRQSVIMFHMQDDPIHAMLYWNDFGTMMEEIAFHYSIDREDVLDCHELVVKPHDIPEGTTPLIIQQVQDIPVGEISVLILVDLDLHGQHMEAHYQVHPQTIRQVIAVPGQLTRHALLMRANVFEYCRLEHYRCLVEHNHSPWIQQVTWPRVMRHGDYVKIKIPPPRLLTACTAEMLDDSRRLAVAEFWYQYYVPTSPSASSSGAGTVDDVSPSLVPSEDVRVEFGQQGEESDFSSFMQRPSSSSSSSDLPPSSQPSGYQLALDANSTCVLSFSPDNQAVLPLWYRALVSAFTGGATVENDDEGPVLYITTWYITCLEEHTSEDSRNARLDVMSNLWVADILHLWRDKVQQGVPVFFTWVRPSPMTSPLAQTAGHLIVYQYACPAIVPVLISFQFLALRLDGAAHAVAAVRKDASAEQLLDLVQLRRVCLGRKCTFHRGAVGMTLRDPIQIGEGLRFVIPPPGGRPDDDLVLRSLSVELLQTGPPLIEDFGPSLHIEDQPLSVQNLYARWRQEATRGNDGPAAFLEVTTWYLDGSFMTYNDQPRPVLLGDDFHNWISEFRRIWHDLEDVVEDFAFVVVTPTPAGFPLGSIHLLLFQQISLEQRGVLVTTYDNAVTSGSPFTAAVVLSSTVDDRQIVTAARRARDLDDPNAHCSVWFGGLEITSGTSFEPQLGVALNIDIHRAILHAWDAQSEDNDEQTLLQTGARCKNSLEDLAKADVARTSLQQVANQQSNHFDPLHLNMKDALDALEWYDAYFALPAFDVENKLAEDVHWHPDSLQWLRAPWFSFEGSVTKVRIYYDGSFLPQSAQIGFAAAAFVQQEGDWLFAGALSGQVTAAEDQGSYHAEVYAANVATKLLYDMCKVLFEVFACIPICEMVFDSLTVGCQAEGLWKAQRAVHACHLIRSVLRLCEERFMIQVQHSFSPGHAGEPGNELVDTLAKCAAHGKPLQDWSHFLQFALRPHFVQAMEWTWMLFTHIPDVEFRNSGFHFPAKPCTQPSASVVPLPSSGAEQNVRAIMSLSVATCNVLTLRSQTADKHDVYGSIGPARQEWILDTFQQHHIHIFGLQETRLKKITRYNDPHFILVKSAATQQGHYGMMIGISKVLPHGFIDGKPIFFSEDDYRIVVAQPRLLIVRIRSSAMKCLIINAHAPHTGSTLNEIEIFWQQVNEHISDAYVTWPKILLTDANCRLGGQPDERIGTWQSEGVNEKSQPFIDFLAVNDIFLPSTFEQYHQGVGGTWRHHDDVWKRNDFVGISTALALSACRTWIPEEIDFSLLKDDHRPLFAEVSWVHDFPADGPRKRQVKPGFDDFQSHALHCLSQQPPASFHVDVHTHAHDLQVQILSCCQHQKTLLKRPRKRTISDATWQIIESKRKWRHILAEHQQLQKRTLLACVFAVWRQSRCKFIPLGLLTEFDLMLAQLDRSVAHALWRFRQLGNRVTAALRRDDAEFFGNLASAVSECLGPHQTREFWKVLRRSLPKFQQRRIGQDPHKLEVLQDQWIPYFQQLECGKNSTVDELVHQCHLRQIDMPVVQTEFMCQDIPSLIELEDVLRATQADRATGIDPLPSNLFSKEVVSMAKIYFPLGCFHGQNLLSPAP